MADHRVAADEGRPLDPGGICHRGALVDPLGRPSALAGDLAVHAALQGVPVGLEVALDAADVAPVAPPHDGPERVMLAEHLGKDILRPVAGLALRAVVEHRRLDHVDTGVDLVAEDLPPGWLLQEALYPTIGRGDDHPVLERVGHPGQHHGGLGGAVPVEGHGLGEIDVGEGIAADHDEGLVEKTGGVLDAPGGAQRPVLDHVLEVHAQLGAVTEVVANAGTQVLEGDHHLGDPMTTEQPEHVLHAGPAHHRNQWFGATAGQRAQPATLPASHNHRLHRSTP